MEVTHSFFEMGFKCAMKNGVSLFCSDFKGLSNVLPALGSKEGEERRGEDGEMDRPGAWS